MITRKGTQICEKCGKTYDWVVKMLEEGDIVVGFLEDMKSQNILKCGVFNGVLLATSRCPHCGTKQMKYVVSEKL